MYSVNKFVASSTYAWPGWTLDGSDAKQLWTGVPLSQNATAQYRVYLYNYRGVSAPKIISRGTVRLGNGGAPIEKWIEVTLNKTSKFANGLVAKNSIVFNGNNATVDSWNSEKDPATGLPRVPAVAYSSTYRRDNGTVGSIAISSDAVLVKNADVWGYVSNNSQTSSQSPADFVASNGSILGTDSPGGSNVDPSRVSTTFSASFSDITIPTESLPGNLGNINTSMTLPLAADVALFPTGNGTGDYAGYYVYDASKIAIGANDVLSITGKVCIKLSSTVDTGGGNGEIAILANGYLSIYTAASINLAGKGVTNGVDLDTPADGVQADELGQPKKFQIWGTATSGTQNINITGSSQFSGIIYAPQGNVQITGNGAVCGSIVAQDITLSGNAQFHYDESLADLGGGSPFRVSKWKELTTAADRAAYETVLTW
jgi:hypothetical protein